MKVKFMTMQNISKTRGIIKGHVVDLERPLANLEQRFQKILEKAHVDEYSQSKKIVFGEAPNWADELTYNCIFVIEREKGNIYEFGCFAHFHPYRARVRKTYKTFKGMVRYLPKFITNFPSVYAA